MFNEQDKKDLHTGIFNPLKAQDPQYQEMWWRSPLGAPSRNRPHQPGYEPLPHLPNPPLPSSEDMRKPGATTPPPSYEPEPKHNSWDGITDRVASPTREEPIPLEAILEAARNPDPSLVRRDLNHEAIGTRLKIGASKWSPVVVLALLMLLLWIWFAG